MTLEANVVANFLGQGWRALMSLAFVPLYIKLLGVEAYGLIGIFAVLQAWLGLLDLGMKPALVREMARFTGGSHDAQSIWDLLRSIEIISIAIAIFVATAVWAGSGFLATDWVRAEKLTVATVARVFALMGVVTALQFMESIYTNCIAGLQRQVLQNGVTSLMATVRSAGAIAILVWVSPTIDSFFIWQGLMSLVTVVVCAQVVSRVLPRPPRGACFSLPALLGIWRYAAGMVGITLLTLLLTQIDKLLLSRLLSLDAFAHYALAGTVAGALSTLGAPITAAFYPRFTTLTMQGDDASLRAAYHQGAQLVAVLLGAAAAILIIFGDRVLLLWTQDPALVSHVAPVLRVLAVGALFNGLMGMPYLLQLAHGWTSLTIKANSVAVVILVPAILWVVPRHGAIGAAWVWVALNAGYIVFDIYFMHRRLLPIEKWLWYREDVAFPLAAAMATAWLCRWMMPEGLGQPAELGALSLSSGCVLFVAALATPLMRRQVSSQLYGWLRGRTERQWSIHS